MHVRNHCNYRSNTKYCQTQRMNDTSTLHQFTCGHPAFALYVYITRPIIMCQLETFGYTID